VCDTLVALGNATTDGSVLFAKNSNRDPNEAHQVVYVPEATHLPGSMVKCTYISIPQVEKTHAVLLAKPFWIWGAEMGANDQGVVIGNEAVFSREPYGKEPGLIGMDFLRLALERFCSAKDALLGIVALLEQYGQSGNCGYGHSLYYHNSFLIADRKEAWVLETAGKQWVAEKVKDVRTISNLYTIQTEWDMASPDLVDYALERKYCKDRSNFNFAKCYSDFIYTTFADGRRRQCFTSSTLNKSKGKINFGLLMSLLRNHEPLPGGWSPDRGIIGQDVCAHAGFGPIRISQTTGSMVSSLSSEGDIHWVTATSTPCTAIFKPVWLDAGVPDMGAEPGGEYNPDSLWWRHEILQREVQKDYKTRLAVFIKERDLLETAFLHKALSLKTASREDRRSFSDECFRQSSEAERRWAESVKSAPIKRKPTLYHSIAWQSFNKKANIPR